MFAAVLVLDQVLAAEGSASGAVPSAWLAAAGLASACSAAAGLSLAACPKNVSPCLSFELSKGSA